MAVKPEICVLSRLRNLSPSLSRSSACAYRALVEGSAVPRDRPGTKWEAIVLEERTLPQPRKRSLLGTRARDGTTTLSCSGTPPTAAQRLYRFRWPRFPPFRGAGFVPNGCWERYRVACGCRCGPPVSSTGVRKSLCARRRRFSCRRRKGFLIVFYIKHSGRHSLNDLLYSLQFDFSRQVSDTSRWTCRDRPKIGG